MGKAVLNALIPIPGYIKLMWQLCRSWCPVEGPKYQPAARTYILYSAELDKCDIGYIGESLTERLRKHLSHHEGCTAQAKDWTIVHSEQYESKEQAYVRERLIKSWKSKKMIEQLIARQSSGGSEHPDL